MQRIVEGDEILVGISAHASEQLGDVVFIELPEEGREVEAGEDVVVIESVKAASEITSPVAGIITAVNSAAARFASPSFEPRVATTSVSGSSFTPKRRS